MISYEHLYELQRFAELGRMSACLLHQIRTPLTAAMLNLELSEQSAGVRRARYNMRLLRQYVEAARQQARPGGQPVSFNLRPQLSQLRQVLTPMAVRAGVKLDLQPAPRCRLRGDPVRFQHIITNLVVNAIEAYDGQRAGGQPVVGVAFECRSGQLIIKVTDCGKGIPAGALSQVFEPFYSTKSSRGLGIGLAIVKQYVTTEFSGSITVTSSPKHGTRFTIKLPR